MQVHGGGELTSRNRQLGGMVQTRGKKVLKLEGSKGYPPNLLCFQQFLKDRHVQVLPENMTAVLYRTKPGGHKEQEPDGTSSSDPDLGGEQFSLFVHSPSERHRKHPSRSPQQEREI